MVRVQDVAPLAVESQPIRAADCCHFIRSEDLLFFVLGCEGNEKPIQRSVLYETILPRARCCAAKVMRACETQRQDT